MVLALLTYQNTSHSHRLTIICEEVHDEKWPNRKGEVVEAQKRE